MNTRQRVRARVVLSGRLSVGPQAHRGVAFANGAASLHVVVDEVAFEDLPTPSGAVTLQAYQAAQPDPLHVGAAEQLQHLVAHHQEAIAVLARLCDTESLLGAVRILPIALDRYGIVLRIERMRGHRDVRLSFRRRVDSGVEAAVELRHLLSEGGRRRPCQRTGR